MGKRFMFSFFSMALTLVMSVLMLSLAPATQVDAQTFGTGPWASQFFNSPDFTNPVSCAGANPVYTILNFNWAGNPTLPDNVTPVPCVNADNFSVRFTSIQAFTAGTFTFTMTVDNAASLTLNGTQVLQILNPGTQSVQVSLGGGNVAMQVDFTDFSGNAILSLLWTGGTGQIGLPTPIVTPTPALPEGPIGRVVNVSGLSLRTGPYLGASLIGVLRQNIAYPVLAQNNDEGGGFTWYQVRDGDRIGWASGRYLVVTNGTPPVASTIFEQIDNIPDTTVRGAPNAFMNIRRRPSTRSQILGQVPWGEEVIILGQTLRGGSSFWMHIRYQGITGWIFAPYVKNIRGNLGSVPIR